MNQVPKNAPKGKNDQEAAVANQLGTFGGVFTPSILTILGVIMFMRGGFVIGESKGEGTHSIFSDKFKNPKSSWR